MSNPEQQALQQLAASLRIPSVHHKFLALRLVALDHCHVDESVQQYDRLLHRAPAKAQCGLCVALFPVVCSSAYNSSLSLPPSLSSLSTASEILSSTVSNAGRNTVSLWAPAAPVPCKPASKCLQKCNLNIARQPDGKHVVLGCRFANKTPRVVGHVLFHATSRCFSAKDLGSDTA